MPNSRELQNKETHLTETEEETEEEYANPWVLRDGQAAAGSLPRDEGGGLPAGGDNDGLFSFITEERLQEAQEFRRKGHNRQIPEIDPGLLTKLHKVLGDAKSRLVSQASVEGPLGSGWLLNHVDQIQKLADHLSDDGMQSWVEREVPRKRDGKPDSRHNAQSLVRRLESILQTLLRVVHLLRTLDDHSTRDRREALLVAELTGAFPTGDENRVKQALDTMTKERTDYSAWNSLIQDRGAEWEAEKAADIGAMIKLARHEEDKAYEKLTGLRGGGGHDFLSDAAGYFTWLSQDLIKALAGASQRAASPVMQFVSKDKENTQLTEDVEDVNYYMANFFLPGELEKASANASQGASSSRLDALSRSVETGLMKAKVAGTTAKKIVYSGAGFTRERHSTDAERAAADACITRILMNWSITGIPQNSEEILEARLTQKSPEKPKLRERAITDSIIRSILWQWQQTAIKIQHASGAIQLKVEELQKIEGVFSTYAKEGHPEGRDTPLSYPGNDDMEAQVRQWVKDSLEPETPEAKVAVLKQLLDADIDRARRLVARLGNSEESIENTLRQQQFAVLSMIFKRLNAVAPSLKAVDALLPKVAEDLAAGIAALDKALQAAGNPSHDFVGARNQASKAQLIATELKEKLSGTSAQLTGRSLNEHSRGSRLAKHWANLARERVQGNHPVPDAAEVLASLKNRGLPEGVLSAEDPEGYLFATRLAGELENARNDELRLPMSPEQYTALEKGLVEYIVKWGQKRVSRGAARMIIELSFEQGLEAVTFGVSRLLRLPFKVLKATIKVPYHVSKVSDYTMPGQDKPYKAIYGMLEKRLKQLGFNLVTAPVPGVIKAAVGGVITAGAALYNLHVENKENIFSAVYERLTEGKTSKKIKMQSVGTMVFDTALDTGISAGYKGARIAWGAGSENRAIPDNEFVNGQAEEGKAEEAELLRGGREPEEEGKAEEDEKGSNSGQPRVRHRRAIPDTGDSPYVPAFIKTAIESKGLSRDVIINSILDSIRSDSTVMGLNRSEREKAFLIKTLQYLSVLTKRYRHNVVKKYQPLIDELWSGAKNRFPLTSYLEEIDSYIPEDPKTSEINTRGTISYANDQDIQERIEAAFEHFASTIDTLKTPVLDMGIFIDDKITDAIRQFNANPMRYNPKGKWPGQDSWESYARTATPWVNPDTKIQVRISSGGRSDNHEMTLRDVIMGRHIHLRNEKGIHAQVFIDTHKDMISWIRDKYGLEEKVIQAVRDLRDSVSKVNTLASYTEGMMRLRCVEYLVAKEVSGDSEYTQAVKDFLDEKNHAQEVFFNGVKLNDAFMIPVPGTKKGVLFSVNESAFFDVKEKNMPYTVIRKIRHQAIPPNKMVSEFPTDTEFEKWILNRIPIYKRDNSVFQPNSIMEITDTFRDVYGGAFSTVRETNEKHPFSFTASSSHSDIARKLVTGLLDRLDSDADSLIRTEQEDNTERWLEIGKALTMYASIMMLPVNMGATGPLATGLAMGAMATLDAAYVWMALEQAKNADTAGEASAHRADAILAGVLAGLGHAATGATMIKPAASRLVSVYRQAKLSLKSGTVASIGQYGWRRLGDTGKASLMKNILSKTPSARQLVQRLGSQGVDELIEAAALARKGSSFSVTEKEIQRLLEQELKELTEADSVLEKYLDSPLLLPRGRSAHSYYTEGWISRGGNIRNTAVSNIISNVDDNAYSDIFNIDTINTIYREITGGGDGIVRGLGASGSSLKKEGFTKALNKIRSLNASFQGEALYVAIMHYKPFATNNRAMARMMYTLAELQPQRKLRLSLRMVAPLREETENILSRKFSLPGEHAISQQEKELILDDNTKLINYHHPKSEHTFKVGNTELVGKRENGVFSISRDNGATWEASDSKSLLTAWSLQNAGGKNKAWSLLRKLTGNERRDPIPGSSSGERTRESRLNMLKELHSDPMSNRVLWHDDWEGRLVDRDAALLKANFDQSVTDMGGAEMYRELLGIDPESINSPICGVSAQNIFKLMVEDSVPINPVTLPKFTGISYQDLMAKLESGKSYVVIVNDQRIGHKYLIDLPATEGADRDAFVIQSDAGMGVMPQLDINMWLTRRGGDVIEHEDLTKLYTDGFTGLPQDSQRRLLASVLDIDKDPSKVRLNYLKSDKKWDFTIMEYTPEGYQRNLDKLRPITVEQTVPMPTLEQWAKLDDKGKLDLLATSLRNTGDARELVRLSGSEKAVEQSIELGRPRQPTGRINNWQGPQDELNRARENLGKHAKVFKMPVRPVIEDSPAATLPEEMRNYLPELRRHQVIGPYISNPSGKCEASMVPVANFMREQGFTDIKYRGMFGWKLPSDMDSFNHYVVVGTKDGKQYVFDLTAGQFEREGMPLLNGPKILSETDWAKLYQDSALTQKLFVYRDFTTATEATTMFGRPPATLFDALENGMCDITVLKEPRWYKTYLRQKFPWDE